MSRILSLKLNSNLGVLQVQEVEFGNEKNGLVEIKAPVGSGKTTVKHGTELAISAGNEQVLPFDTKALEDIDVEVKLTYSDHPIYMRTYRNAAGKLNSVAYVKTEDGKVAKDPVINGKKLTPAVLRDVLRTELTFNIESFLSENPKVHMDFMMKIYSHKLKELGVVFDTKSEAYKGSILYRLEQAKLNRADKHARRRELNAFKESLIEEGFDENNVSPIVDIEAIKREKEAYISKEKDKHNEAVRVHYKAVSDKKDEIQAQINDITSKANDFISKITAYNSNIENEKKLWLSDVENQIRTFNAEQSERQSNIDKANSALAVLRELGYVGIEVTSWMGTMPHPLHNKTIDDFEKPSFAIVPFENGKITSEAFSTSFTPEIDSYLKQITELRAETRPLIAEKDKIGNEPAPEAPTIDTDSFDGRILAAEDSNKIAKRWNAFHDWQYADDEVKSIWREYCNMYSQIDLGVKGLSIRVVGDEDSSEIRTHYNGQHNPEFFGNKDMEPRLLTQYSATQRPIIAILLQIYLLEEKIKKGEDGLRLMWIECPIDNKTRDLLINVQNEHDITIVVGVTGDFTVEGLKNGEFLIENGMLLANK